jgi:hypothetical protein
MTSTSEITKTPVTIDARGPRWSALLTVIVLSIALVTSNVWVALAQGAVFAIGALRGPQFTPYALFFKRIIKPRLKSTATFEDVRPPQFAQTVGLAFAVVAVIGSFTGVDAVFTIAIAFALAAAFLNAAFNFCLGCEMYLLILRARGSK